MFIENRRAKCALSGVLCTAIALVQRERATNIAPRRGAAAQKLISINIAPRWGAENLRGQGFSYSFVLG